MNGSSNGAFPISVRSDNSLGKKIAVEQSGEAGTRFTIGQMLAIFLGLMVAQVFIVSILRTLRRKRQRKLDSNVEFTPGLNNVGFILLHQGLFVEARRLFEAEIDQGRGDQIAVSNLALSMAFTDDRDGALARIKAISWLAADSHTRAVVTFNQSLIAYNGKQIDEGWKLFQRAVSLSEHIKIYAENSSLVDEFSKVDARLLSFANGSVD